MSRVEKGAELLDQIFPGWYKHIDLIGFNITNSQQCIIGQLKGVLGFSCNNLPFRTWQESEVYGFNPPKAKRFETEDKWIEEIHKRLISDPTIL